MNRLVLLDETARVQRCGAADFRPSRHFHDRIQFKLSVAAQARLNHVPLRELNDRDLSCREG